jgi:hypothetical protein
MGFIDSTILDVTEWFCHRFQLLTGRTNVWLAVHLTNLSIVVYFVWGIAYFWSSDWGSRILFALFFGGLLYVLTQTIFREPIESYETSAYQRVQRGYRNPRRIRDAPLRISFLTLSILLFYPILLAYTYLRVPLALLTYSLIVLTTVLLYVLACDMLPPCAGTVKEWLRGLKPASRAAAVAAADKRADVIKLTRVL